MHIIDLVKRYKKLITFALSLVVIENLAWIVEPYFFGQVIDAVIDKAFVNPESSYLFPLLIWIGMFAINSGVGTFRRIYDTRIYLKIFTSLATDVAKTSLKKNLTVSTTAARVELSHQYITFFEYRVPEILENMIAISGAIVAMYFFDWRISLTCLVIVFPLYFIGKLYSKKVVKLQKEYHDGYEEIYNVFDKKDPEYVKEYFTKLAVPQRKISNWGAFNFGLVRVVLLLIFLVVLWISIDLDDFSAGELYSIVAYLWTFVTSSEYLPELMENWTALKDISRRLKHENI